MPPLGIDVLVHTWPSTLLYAFWAVKDVSISTLDSLSPAVCTPSPPEEADDNSILHVGSSPVEGTGGSLFTGTSSPRQEERWFTHGQSCGDYMPTCWEVQFASNHSLGDLSLVLEALCGLPFEPIESADMIFLSYKTALLLDLTSAKRVGNPMQCICLRLSPQPIALWLLSSWATIPLRLHLRSRGGYIPCALCVHYALT